QGGTRPRGRGAVAQYSVPRYRDQGTALCRDRGSSLLDPRSRLARAARIPSRARRLRDHRSVWFGRYLRPGAVPRTRDRDRRAVELVLPLDLRPRWPRALDLAHEIVGDGAAG